MRIIVVGAGAVGGVVAANLAMAGTPVVAVARGDHARVMRESGLRYESPSGTRTVELPVATSVGELDITDDDVFVLGVKSQDTVGVLTDLRAAGVTDQPIVCMQNGVENERQALRLFPNVYGICVMLPAEHLAPGVVASGPHRVPGSSTSAATRAASTTSASSSPPRSKRPRSARSPATTS